MPVDVAQAPCSGWGLIFHAVPSSGVLRKHGHGGSCPPCVGLGVPPMGATVPIIAAASHSLLDRRMCLSLFSNIPASPDGDGDIFDFPKITGKLLKRIPNACRRRAALAFEKCLRLVISNGKTAFVCRFTVVFDII